ncbi:RrF2 family transcriptional regulator [Desulfurivibrio sp. D14AmB]|uniref:RrF2 family transcriptional regulator n=1 Tax=Desulfurivibrio sp. D14AmB TaxID=3374370 RepID=UPI00376F2C79
MQITRETDYALRAVQYLAQRPGEVCMVDKIAAESEVPKSFLAKIIQKLTRAGLVESHRGAGGGYTLRRPAAEISLYDVIEIIEGPPLMNTCTTDARKCGRGDHCAIHPVWISLRREVEALLKARKFSEFIADKPGQ